MFSPLWAFVICYRVNFTFTSVGVEIVQGRNGWTKMKDRGGNRLGGAQLASFATDSSCNPLWLPSLILVLLQHRGFLLIL